MRERRRGGGGTTPAQSGGPTTQGITGTRVRLDSPTRGTGARVSERSRMPDVRLLGSAAGDRSGRFPLTVRPALRGSDSETLRVRATGAGGSNSPPPAYEETPTVNDTVDDKASVDVVFVPKEIVATRVQGDNPFEEQAFDVLARPGATLTCEAIEYHDNPPAANGQPNVASWFQSFPLVGTSSRFDTGTSGDGLPAGEHSARLRDRRAKNGASGTIRVPVRRTISP